MKFVKRYNIFMLSCWFPNNRFLTGLMYLEEKKERIFYCFNKKKLLRILCVHCWQCIFLIKITSHHSSKCLWITYMYVCVCKRNDDDLQISTLTDIEEPAPLFTTLNKNYINLFSFFFNSHSCEFFCAFAQKLFLQGSI